MEHHEPDRIIDISRSVVNKIIFGLPGTTYGQVRLDIPTGAKFVAVPYDWATVSQETVKFFTTQEEVDAHVLEQEKKWQTRSSTQAI